MITELEKQTNPFVELYDKMVTDVIEKEKKLEERSRFIEG